ncbi:MAG: penicillin acylase family protein, partial [Pirellulaceae bacterium]
DVSQFRAALEAWKAPGENFVYADVDGHIGWVASARTPIRQGWDGLLPVPGATGAFEWQGYLASSDLPQLFDPPQHWIATANHNILPRGYTHSIAYEWASSHRYERLREELDTARTFSIGDFQRLQHDCTSLPGRSLQSILRSVELPAELAPYTRLILDWDGVLSAESQAGPLYATWVQELMRGVFDARMPQDARLDRGDLRSMTVLLHALENPSTPWFGDRPREARDALVRETFAAAVARTRKLLGDETATWSWGRLHTATLHHPLAELGPAYAQLFNTVPVPRPGDTYTPNNTRHDERFAQIHGASYRQIFDLAEWDRGVATSMPGQSGQAGSAHYQDLLPLWAAGEYFPLAFTRKKVEEVTQHRLALRPGP